MRRILAILLENESGSLSRVAGLFSARAVNIESLSVTPTLDETLSRMTLVTYGDDRIIEQITKQLNKLVDVLTVMDLTNHKHVEHELALVKLKLSDVKRLSELEAINETYGGCISDTSALCYTNKVVGTSEEINTYIAALSKHDVIEVVRSGPLGIVRGERVLSIRD